VTRDNLQKAELSLIRPNCSRGHNQDQCKESDILLLTKRPRLGFKGPVRTPDGMDVSFGSINSPNGSSEIFSLFQDNYKLFFLER